MPDYRAPRETRLRPRPWVLITLLLLLLSSAVFALTVPDVRRGVEERVGQLTELIWKAEAYRPPPCISFVAVDRREAMEQQQRGSGSILWPGLERWSRPVRRMDRNDPAQTSSDDPWGEVNLGSGSPWRVGQYYISTHNQQARRSIHLKNIFPSNFDLLVETS